MKEYIEREAALNELKEELEYDTPFYTEEQNKFINSGLRIAVKDIKRLPKADVREVIHAKWEWFDVWEDDDEFGKCMQLRCSSCLETEGARENAKFCSNCGAIMDLKD